MADDKRITTLEQFSQLPHGSWRGTIFPILERSVRFAHEGTDHQIIYRNGVAVEMTGAGARVLTYTVPFREGVTRGPYGHMFTGVLLRFWKSYYDDKSPGPLYDPIYGELTCVPQEWDESTDVNKRDGVDVRVSFKVDSPPDGTTEPAPASLDSLESDTRRLDTQVQAVDWPVQVNSPHTTGDIFSQIAGVIQQGNFAVNRLKGKLSEVTMRIKEVEDAAVEAEAQTTSGAGFLRQEARKIRLKSMRVEMYPSGQSANTVVKRARNANSTVFVEAQRAGMTLQDFLNLNPDLARVTVIHAGTPFWIRKPKP